MQQKLIIYPLYSVFCFLSSVFYICRETSTNQPIFMQNKANFKIGKMNVKSFGKRDYHDSGALGLRKNKPNSKPNKPNFKIGKMNVTSVLTKNYNNEQ